MHGRKNIKLYQKFCLFLARQPPVGQDLLIHEEYIRITQNDAPQSVGLLWTSDQFVADTST
jgi:hypothetical protein